MNHNMENDASDPMVAWMRQLANNPPERSHRPLPDPDLLWMKAQLLDRQHAMEHTLRFARWVETAARVLVGFAACWLATGLTRTVVMPAMAGLNPTLLSLGVSLILVAVAMVAFPIWSDES